MSIEIIHRQANGTYRLIAGTEGRNVSLDLATDDERAAFLAGLDVAAKLLDRQSKLDNDASLAAAYEAHPEIGDALEAQTFALAKANARLVELGETPVEVDADANAESPEKSTAPQGFAQPITTRGL